MGNLEAWEIFASLGVPGLAFGVLYMLFQKFDWKLPAVPKSWVGPLLLLFMILTSGIVLTALILWRPERGGANDTENSSHSPTLAMQPEWEHYGEKEVAGEFVAVSQSPLSFEEAEQLRGELRRLSDLAQLLMPSTSGEYCEEGTYDGYLRFARSDAHLVRSLREAGKWNVVIDLVSRERTDPDGIKPGGETLESADRKMYSIVMDCEAFVVGKLRGTGKDATPAEKELNALGKKLFYSFFRDAVTLKYDITAYEEMYKHPLNNVAAQE